MRRWLFNVFCAMSLLLCVAAAALWVRAVRGADQFIFTTGGRLWWVMSGHGGTVNVICVRRWPRPERFRWVTDDSDSYAVPTVSYTAPPDFGSQWRAAGISGENTEVSTWLDQAGTPVSLAESENRATRHGGPVHESGMMPCRSVTVPLWMPLVLGGIAPGVFIATRSRSRRRRRVESGLCPSCSYDLRASPGRCPECGATPAAKRDA